MKDSFGIINRVSFGNGRVTHGGRSWPLAGTRASVSNERFGLAGRKHVITLTVTRGGQPVVTWQATRTGAAATSLYRSASTFAANLNGAAGPPGTAPATGPAARAHRSAAARQGDLAEQARARLEGRA